MTVFMRKGDNLSTEVHKENSTLSDGGKDKSDSSNSVSNSDSTCQNPPFRA